MYTLDTIKFGCILKECNSIHSLMI